MNNKRDDKITIDTIDVLESSERYSMYYDNISVIFRVLSFVLFAVFLLFIVTSAFVEAESFTYENLEFIVRNFALRLDENRNESIYAINYNPDANRSFALFGKGLAVCGSSQLSVFSGTGRLTCSEPIAYKEPVMLASEKFVLVYDSGTNEYTVFNSFTDVYTSHTSYPIRGAAIANNGAHALITSSESYNSVVEVFNANYQRKNLINRTGYISAVDITNTHVLVASADIDSTNAFLTKLTYSEIGAETESVDITIEDDFPLSCEIIDNGLVVVCIGAVYSYNLDGTLVGAYEYDSSPVDFVVDDTGVLLLFKNSGFDIEYSIICITRSGDVRFERTITSTVSDIEYKNNIAYVLFDDKVSAITEYETLSVMINGTENDTELLVYDDYKLYVCNASCAPMITLVPD